MQRQTLRNSTKEDGRFLEIAQDIESYFINEKGINDETGGNLSADSTVCICIFQTGLNAIGERF